MLVLLLSLLVPPALGRIKCGCKTNLQSYGHGRYPYLQIDDCASYYRVGLCQGSAFHSLIRERLGDSANLARIQAYADTPKGTKLLKEMKDLHYAEFPDYMDELQGIADGAAVPLDKVFLMNLRSEFPQMNQSGSDAQPKHAFIKPSSDPSSQVLHEQDIVDEGCSDVLVNYRGVEASLDGHAKSAAGCSQFRHSGQQAGGSRCWDGISGSVDGSGSDGRDVSDGSDDGGGSDGSDGGDGSDGSDKCIEGGTATRVQPKAIIAHNEDVGPDAVKRLYFVRVAQTHHTWLALCYAGELASTAFGASLRSGIIFTLNAIYPAPEAMHLPGVGRNFISRRLLEVPTFQAGLDLLNVPDQVTGRSYNLLNLHGQPEPVNIEIAPGRDTSILEVEPGTWHFHANAYLRLRVPEFEGALTSSRHREAVAERYKDFPLSGPDGALELLGDTSDADWPVYRGGVSPVDTGFTECTLLIEVLPSKCDRNDRDDDDELDGQSTVDGLGGHDLHKHKRGLKHTVRATVLQGNPRDGDQVVQFDLGTLLPVASGRAV